MHGLRSVGCLANDLDAGLVLPLGFDEAVQAGEQPELQFFVGGESLASNRLILAVTTLDAVRAVEGTTPPVDVEIEYPDGDLLLSVTNRGVGIPEDRYEELFGKFAFIWNNSFIRVIKKFWIFFKFQKRRKKINLITNFFYLIL